MAPGSRVFRSAPKKRGANSGSKLQHHQMLKKIPALPRPDGLTTGYSPSNHHPKWVKCYNLIQLVGALGCWVLHLGTTLVRRVTTGNK